MGKYTKRVQRGAALLDARKPGWDARIAVAELDVASYRNGVLGQIFGNHDRGVWELWPEGMIIHNRLSADHGFSLSEADIAERGETGYPELIGEWRELIRKRR